MTYNSQLPILTVNRDLQLEIATGSYKSQLWLTTVKCDLKQSSRLLSGKQDFIKSIATYKVDCNITSDFELLLLIATYNSQLRLITSQLRQNCQLRLLKVNCTCHCFNKFE